jgi:phosphatidylglycerol---prolipoprotein diacylglyceryl transferase
VHVTPAAWLLAIEIPWDPDITTIAGFLLTWHGVFTAVGILAGVRLALWAASKVGYDLDDAYTLALIGVPSGIVGARLLFVTEHWDFYGSNPGQIIAITEGGISIWGAVLGGVLGPVLFAWWKGWPVAKGLDAASLGIITGMGIGRIGDLINGEHLANATDLPWGVIYTHPNSPAFAHSLVVGAHHPATTYEMIGDFVILGLLFVSLFKVFPRRHGLTFFVFLIGYSVLRLWVSTLRLDSAETFLFGVTVPQLVSLTVIAASIPVVAWLWMRGPVEEPAEAAPPGRVEVRGR